MKLLSCCLALVLLSSHTVLGQPLDPFDDFAEPVVDESHETSLDLISAAGKPSDILFSPVAPLFSSPGIHPAHHSALSAPTVQPLDVFSQDRDVPRGLKSSIYDDWFFRDPQPPYNVEPVYVTTWESENLLLPDAPLPSLDSAVPVTGGIRRKRARATQDVATPVDPFEALVSPVSPVKRRNRHGKKRHGKQQRTHPVRRHKVPSQTGEADYSDT